MMRKALGYPETLLVQKKSILLLFIYLTSAFTPLSGSRDLARFKSWFGCIEGTKPAPLPHEVHLNVGVRDGAREGCPLQPSQWEESLCVFPSYCVCSSPAGRSKKRPREGLERECSGWLLVTSSSPLCLCFGFQLSAMPGMETPPLQLGSLGRGEAGACAIAQT